MNPFNIFTNKNDLVKILSIGGFLALLFSLLYPIEKRRELDIKKVELNSNIRNLNVEIKDAYSLVDIAKNSTKTSNEFKSELNNQAKLMKKNIQTLYITVKKNQDEIFIIEKYIKEYYLYEQLFFWGGLLTSIIGTFFWSISGISEYKRLTKTNVNDNHNNPNIQE